MGDDSEAPEVVGGELVPADSSQRSPRPGEPGAGRPYQKGVSGNPGGRSGERDALRKWLMRTYTRDAVEAIAKLAGLIQGENGARSEFVRLDALKWLGEQGIGTAAAALRLLDDDGNEVKTRVGIIVLPAERGDDE